MWPLGRTRLYQPGTSCPDCRPPRAVLSIYEQFPGGRRRASLNSVAEACPWRADVGCSLLLCLLCLQPLYGFGGPDPVRFLRATGFPDVFYAEDPELTIDQVRVFEHTQGTLRKWKEGQQRLGYAKRIMCSGQ